MIVENQLESSDHIHLGQILTYAAGTDASTIVWLAGEFREEHRQAIDWINERTNEDTRFFGVRIGLRRIGDSPPAPLFDVVAQPNDWQKHVRAVARSAQMSGRGKLYLEFWTRYLSRLDALHPNSSRAKPTASNAIVVASSIRGAYLNPLFAERDRIGHQLWIDSGDADYNRAVFQLLESNKETIEQVYGSPLEWDYREDRKACKVGEYVEGQVNEEHRHDEFIAWFIDSGERFRRALDAIEIPPSMAR